MENNVFIGIHVRDASIHLCVIDSNRVLKKQQTIINIDGPNRNENSSKFIEICDAVKVVIQNIDRDENIAGIGITSSVSLPETPSDYVDQIGLSNPIPIVTSMLDKDLYMKMHTMVTNQSDIPKSLIVFIGDVATDNLMWSHQDGETKFMTDAALTGEGFCNGGELTEVLTKAHNFYPEGLSAKWDAIHKVDNLCKEKNFTFLELCNKTKDFHIVPDFMKYRNPDVEEFIYGVGISPDEENFITLYLALFHAYAFTTRQLLDDLKQKGETYNNIFVTGSWAKSSTYLLALATICKVPVYYFTDTDFHPITFGAALLAMDAVNPNSDQFDIPLKLDIKKIKGNPGTEEFLDRKYKVFQLLCTEQKELRDLMK